jgi:dTDP-4-dehydrorhamnose reductase
LASDRSKLDIGDEAAVRATVLAFQPSLIVNAAAYTAVDKAETEPQQAERANSHAPGYLAKALKSQRGGRLIHVSTDYVFSGKASQPYKPDDLTQPLGVYGRTKLEGEQAAMRELGQQAVVLRTAWVYGAHGKNFVHTMLRLMQEHGSVRVVSDQIGCPTSTASLAMAIWAFAARPDLSGIFHWTDAGVASWYDFAVAIAEEAHLRSLLPTAAEVLAITTADYATSARRPQFSLLDGTSTSIALGIVPQHWRKELRRILDEIAHV